MIERDMSLPIRRSNGATPRMLRTGDVDRCTHDDSGGADSCAGLMS